MTERNTAVIDELLQSLEEAKFEVIDVGSRYRVTNPAGGRPAFVPHRLPRGAKFTQIMASLVRIGFDIAAADAERERRRQARLNTDKLTAAKLMKVAEDAADARSNGTVGAHRAAAVVELATQAVEAVETEPRPRTEVIAFTPAFAEEFLRANRFFEDGATHAGRCNRRYRTYLARLYADAMLRGEWVVTEQGIGVDVDNELTNGQHRLMAVVLAGETDPGIVVEMQVTYDLPREARDVVDSGLRRSLADNLSMLGERYAAQVAAVVRLIHLYDNVPYSPGEWKKRSITVTQAETMLAGAPEIRDAAVFAHNVVGPALKSAAGAALHIISRDWPTHLAEDYIRSVGSGENLAKGDVAYAVREFFLNELARRKRRDKGTHLALLIKGWNLHVEGRTRSLMKWLDSEEFPTVNPPGSTRTPYSADRQRTGSSVPSE